MLEKSNKKGMTVAIAAAVVLGIFGGIAAYAGIIPASHVADAADEGTTPKSRHFTAQKTVMSRTEPLPGHENHQLVFAVPIRDDGKIWTGTVSYTASKPVEVVVLHKYNTSLAVDEAHGEPFVTPVGDGAIAFTLIQQESASESAPIKSGSLTFTGSGLAFHNLNNEPFTVTYSVKAFAYDVNQ
ncbi:MAG TPA: hypothetical protein VF172_00730 [Nitrososphaera sp.]|jgi:hypothetical protein